MSKGFTIELEGLQETLKKLQKTGGDIAKEVEAELGASVEDARKQAVTACPYDTGLLRASISGYKVADLSYELVAQKDYAAYVEFGTGTLVDVPRGLEQYALQFKGKGKKQVNLPARPYLFPAVRNVIPKIIQRITNILREKRN